MKIHLADLTIDPEIQLSSRGIDPTTVQDYVIGMSNDNAFPPIVAYREDGHLRLAAGFHRVEAARFLGLAEIEAEIREGTRTDAMVYAATDNVTNGKPMSQAQKREAGERLLKMTGWNDIAIAQALAVNRETVRLWRKSLISSKTLEDNYARTVARGGTTYTMEVSNIGKKQPDVERAAYQQPIYNPVITDVLADDWEDEMEDELCVYLASYNNVGEDVCRYTGNVVIGTECGPHCKCYAYEEPDSEEAIDHMAVHYSSKTPQHCTPQVIIDATLACLGTIDLDPCSNSHEQPNIPATKHFTEEDDGLAQGWHGRVYMNPPYGREIGNWVEKLCKEHEAGRTTEAIALVPSRTDTQWWLQLRDFPVCFVQGRLTFLGNDDPAPFPSAVFYLGEEISNFYRAFYQLGDCWQRMMPGISFGE